ncbi:hypothetical protein [Pseudolactococcus piscium]|uniref:Uncharacterized protein n=1 Tax=Pseudolactococcus piscium MKFS47 TaxID=297352 RepID=A0A0D6DZI0_9LACT|nr:hypothetical protein [Lactococcus piscium]CEN29372.1 Uncharacterized protein LACPI_2172 [Lactococcus piscium MKFS47]
MSLSLITKIESERYDGLQLIVKRLETSEDNRIFLNGDIIISVILDEVEDLLRFIDNGDLLTLKGSAGTKNKFHMVKLTIENDNAYFTSTSSFLRELPVKECPLSELHTIGIYSKTLYTVSNKTTSKLNFIGIE